MLQKATIMAIALLTTNAALCARADTTEVYYEGVVVLANIRQMPENSVRGWQGELPDFYDGRIWNCEVSPNDSTAIVCIEGWNPPVLSEEVKPPFYRGIEIFFMPGTDPQVFTSVEEIEAAVLAGGVLLHPTEAIFLCTLIGPPGERGATIAQASDSAVRSMSWGLLKSLYR
jgi:hypothetical protein